MVEILFIVLGVVVGYNIRHEWKSHQENLVFEKVDARVRRELEVAHNLNQSLQEDIAVLRQSLANNNAGPTVR